MDSRSIESLADVAPPRSPKYFKQFRALSWQAKTGVVVSVFLLLAVAAACLAPFLWMVSRSLMVASEIYTVPPTLLPEQAQWGNYWRALTGTGMPFGRFFLNTFIWAVGVIIGRVIVVSMAGYAFARIPFPGRNVIFFGFLATMMIPFTVVLIPAFVILNALGWLNTYYALIFPLINYVYGIFLMRQFLSSLPVSLEDAARIDGAGEFAIYWRIFFPLAKPAVVVIMIFSFMDVWKEFLWALLVTRSQEMRTVEVGLALFAGMQGIFEAPQLQMAAATAVAIPIIIFYLVAQRFFVQGINLAGARKA